MEIPFFSVQKFLVKKAFQFEKMKRGFEAEIFLFRF
jgi:hypothetical protein